VNKPTGTFQGRPIVAQHAGVTVTRVGAYLGAEVAGVDLRKPLSDEVRDAIEDALAENELLIFRNQDISSQNLTHCDCNNCRKDRNFGDRHGVTLRSISNSTYSIFMTLSR
jgi:alpha-ketoglutarate-dependent taurine dioxygenase